MAVGDAAEPVFDEDALDRALTLIIERGRQLIGNADEISVTLLIGPRRDTPACTSILAGLLDEWQYQQRQGPCLDASAYAATVTVPPCCADRPTPTRGLG
ncbi:hypothetical protein BJY16_007487 [Actinoplanes octamycinicus]|uniref:Uncharacterized protein n=1 Tax=Actinoplanes octamycinicus TaxID=135948 RepID=A0A7W7H4U7_9ACTN|nr:hypothetical protein [Actinoplanes octamycinicus]MBB4744028.1 hypothetical protein [Actinoplanes octamycinicus]GIE58653.1 hypothetical protein Aoc01nite_40550 [Actinoplanes octamycinicus]